MSGKNIDQKNGVALGNDGSKAHREIHLFPLRQKAAGKGRKKREEESLLGFKVNSRT